MDKEIIETAVEETPVEEFSVETTQEVEAEVETAAVDETPVENFSEEQGASVESEVTENETVTEEFKKEEECETKHEVIEEAETASDFTEEQKEEEPEEEKEDKYALLEQDYQALQNNYNTLEAEVAELRKFKLNIENQQKDELIASFYMLSDEDKADVIENKANYTLEEIKSKLSVICFDKKVSFNHEEEVTKAEVATTFNLEAGQADNTPAWLKAVKATKERNNK